MGGRQTISATDAAKTFGRLVDRVRDEQATYVIERGGVPVARIGPVQRQMATIRDLRAMLGATRSVGAGYLRAVENAVARHNRPRVRRNPWGR
jgi:antitoxin (DNA-binding transcriptional repressor) of toxin-antitoxin stability system